MRGQDKRGLDWILGGIGGDGIGLTGLKLYHIIYMAQNFRGKSNMLPLFLFLHLMPVRLRSYFIIATSILCSLSPLHSVFSLFASLCFALLCSVFLNFLLLSIYRPLCAPSLTPQKSTGGSLIISDDLAAIPADRVRLAQQLLPATNIPAMPLDLMDKECPEILRLQLGRGRVSQKKG